MIPDRTVTIDTQVTSMLVCDDVDLNCLIS